MIFFNGSPYFACPAPGHLAREKGPAFRKEGRANREWVLRDLGDQNSAQSSSSMLSARLPWLAGAEALRGLGARSS